MAKHKQARPSKTTLIKRALVAIIIALSMVIVAGFSVYFYFLSKINYTPRDDFGVIGEVPTDEIDDERDPNATSEPEPDMGFASGDVIYNANIQNILLIGSDTRSSTSYGRSDSMMLISIDKKSQRIIMTSFLRDLYLKIEGLRDNRINTAYAYGGPKLLMETIENNFRVRIDNYVRVDFQSFCDIIDAIGGIEMELTSAEARELNNNPRRYGEVGKIHKVSTGTNTLDGLTALAYARIRKIDSDFGRSQRQRNVIVAVLGKLKGASVTQLMSIADTFLPSIQTDLTKSQITGLVFDSAKLLGYATNQLTIPTEGAYRNATIREMSVLVPNVEKNKQALWSLIYGR